MVSFDMARQKATSSDHRDRRKSRDLPPERSGANSQRRKSSCDRSFHYVNDKKISRGRKTYHERQSRDRQRSHNYRNHHVRTSAYRPGKYERRRRDSPEIAMSNLNRLQKKEPCDIIIEIGQNNNDFKKFIELSGKNDTILLLLLKALDKGFKSVAIPTILLKVMHIMIEKEFLLHAVNYLNEQIDSNGNKHANLDHLDAMAAVLRIHNKVYELNPSGITFIIGSFDHISNLMDTVRSKFAVDGDGDDAVSNNDDERYNNVKQTGINDVRNNADKFIENSMEYDAQEGSSMNFADDIDIRVENDIHKNMEDNDITNKDDYLEDRVGVDIDEVDVGKIDIGDDTYKVDACIKAYEGDCNEPSYDNINITNEEDKSKKDDVESYFGNGAVNCVQVGIDNNKGDGSILTMESGSESGLAGCLDEFRRRDRSNNILGNCSESTELGGAADYIEGDSNSNVKVGSNANFNKYVANGMQVLSDVEMEDFSDSSIRGGVGDRCVKNDVAVRNTGNDFYTNKRQVSADRTITSADAINNMSMSTQNDELLSDCISFRKKHILTRMASVEQLFKLLGKRKQESMRKCTKRRETVETDAKMDSDESFRDIPVIPRLGDLDGSINPCLRVNKVKGGYHDVDDYLDIQFRLLREDFIEPLRNGIAAYIGQTFGKTKKKLQDIKLYENVRIESFICSDNLCYSLCFDMRKLTRIRWNMTKRLKYGSLVCLSADNFKTCYFATVVNNDIRKTKEGRVYVKFAENVEQMSNLIGLSMTMVESTAYFEAYRPVLTSLQTISADDLPFQEYIIGCKRDVSTPKYIRRYQDNFESCMFDLRPLLEPDVLISSTNRSFETEIKRNGQQHDFSEMSKDLKCVNILQNKWPNEETFNLDISQRNAVKTALTKEFSVIQGPPGCGKTYIGLQIAKVLLHNKDKWRHENGSRSQLLIVCYTNHALDQFIEGITSFFDGDIVRVGSRSRNANVEQHSLKAIKEQFRRNKLFHINLFRRRQAALCHKNTLERILNEQSAFITCLHDNIVNEKALYKEMGHLYNQMTWISDCNFLPPWLRFLGNSKIIRWLGIIDIVKEVQMAVFNEKHGAQKAVGNIDDYDLNDQRDIVNETDQDVSPVKEHLRELAEFKKVNIALDIEGINMFDPDSVSKEKFSLVKRERKAISEKLINLLRDTKPMEEAEASAVKNILSENFTIENRWRLYLYWIRKKSSSMVLKIEKDIRKFEEESKMLNEIHMMENRDIFRAADVIGMTVTGAAMNINVLREIKPCIMIVEEAAEVLESSLISNLTSGCEQLILIGDHKQLKPKPNVYRLEVEYNLNISLFERMVRNGIKCDCLQIQHRMRPTIADNVRDIYNVLTDHESVMLYEPIKGISNDMFFIDHGVEENNDKDMKSYTNKHEAKYLIALCRYLLLQGYDTSEITILTTYKGQMFMVKNEMLNQGNDLEGVRLTVVDDYQGEENEIILLSLVRSNNKNQIGFLKQENRVCVALSRARKGLFVIGNFKNLAGASPVWKGIVASVKQKGLLGQALQLRCQNHPNENGLYMKDSNDFNAVPAGGCEKICDARLGCGHSCERKCHVNNMEHNDIKCKKSCTKKCKNGHSCRKQCWEECRCEEKVTVILPNCGHEASGICSIDIETYECNNVCERKLDCGHICTRVCNAKCICMVPMDVTLPRCGHKTTIPCSIKPEKHRCNEAIQILHEGCGHLETVLCSNASTHTNCEKACNSLLECGHTCKEKCGKQTFQNDDMIRRFYKLNVCPKGHLTFCDVDCKAKLKCGHSCKGKCGHCYNGCWHQVCTEDCKCNLICGHICQGKCGYCLPCIEQCTKMCSHKMCNRSCIQSCDPCYQGCNWSCEHFKCTSGCGEKCNRPRCNQPCNKLLPCDHNCIGMCGDPCPTLCRKCNSDDLTFQHIQKSGARFIQLQNCGHLVEYKMMDKYMDEDEGFCLKRCPLCDMPITTTMGNRYEGVVNRINENLNRVKQMLCNKELNHALETSEFKVKMPFTNNDYIFQFLDCRGALHSINQRLIAHFLKNLQPERKKVGISEGLVFEVTDTASFMHKLHEYECEIKNYLDKCLVEFNMKSNKVQSADGIKAEECLIKANTILDRKVVYTENDRAEVRACINELPDNGINFIRKLLNVSIKTIDICRDDGEIPVDRQFNKAEIISRLKDALHMLKGSCADSGSEEDDPEKSLDEDLCGGIQLDSSGNDIDCSDIEEKGARHNGTPMTCESVNTAGNSMTEQTSTTEKEENVHELTLLTWSGYPYFHSKQSTFTPELESLRKAYEMDKKRQASEPYAHEEPVHKKSKLVTTASVNDDIYSYGKRSQNHQKYASKSKENDSRGRTHSRVEVPSTSCAEDHGDPRKVYIVNPDGKHRFSFKSSQTNATLNITREKQTKMSSVKHRKRKGDGKSEKDSKNRANSSAVDILEDRDYEPPRKTARMNIETSADAKSNDSIKSNAMQLEDKNNVCANFFFKSFHRAQENQHSRHQATRQQDNVTQNKKKTLSKNDLRHLLGKKKE